jgi:hypothetical protein
MMDLGEISWILGVCMTQDRKAGWIALSQEKYILEVFRLTAIRAVKTYTDARISTGAKGGI